MNLSAILTSVFLIIAAVSLSVMELGLRPEMKRFPCVNPLFRGVLAGYAALIFISGADLLNGVWIGKPEHIAPFGVVTALGMALTHGYMFSYMLKMRMPAGAWARLWRRRDAAVLATLIIKGHRAIGDHPGHEEAIAALMAQGAISIANNPAHLGEAAFTEVK
jgi:hypothetical protein